MCFFYGAVVMADVYRVKDWEPFETAQSKNYKTLNWVCLTNKHDGGGYRRLMAREDCASLYGAWMLIVTVASKCEPRGTLTNDGKPLTAEDLHYRTGAPIEVFEMAFKVLSTPEINWLETISLESTEVQESASKSTESHFSLPTNPTQPNKPNPTLPSVNGEGGDLFKKLGVDGEIVRRVMGKIYRRGKMSKAQQEKNHGFVSQLAIMSQLDGNESDILESASALGNSKEPIGNPMGYLRACLIKRIDNFEERLGEMP